MAGTPDNKLKDVTLGIRTKPMAKITFDESTSQNNTSSFDIKSARKVLVVYTGGTIGMMKNTEGDLAPQNGVFERMMRTYPQLHDDVLWTQKIHDPSFDKSLLILPETKDSEMSIVYKILEYETLLDSSNMTEKEWILIAEDIMKHYEAYDGFVVLHGTDTLCYTASALSFMFENIGKGVVFTGAQIPIFEPRSDGIDNFVSSLIIAGGYYIPEVTIFFGGKLLRGNRSRKISAKDIKAFDSPNFPSLVDVGIDFEVNKTVIFKPTAIEKCRLHASMAKNVGLLRIFPNISSAAVAAFCQPPIEGVVLESYGSGNIPSNRQDICDVIAAAVKHGVVFVNITQCNTGSVSSIYETGRFLAEVGVVAGFDMTPEAALTKQAYVLSKGELSYEQKKRMMSTNIRGELTNANVDAKPAVENTLTYTVATCLNIQKTRILEEKVFSALLSYAVERGDQASIKKMLAMGADVNVQNSEGRSALHEAVARGSLAMAELLLLNGANVHLKSRYGEPPLLTAIQRNDVNMINLLCKCGGHLASIDLSSQSEMLSLAARSGNTRKLEALRIAGADLDIPDELGQTPLHKAVLCKAPEVVRYLVNKDVRRDITDVLGHTPVDYAVALQRKDLADLLS